MCPRHRLPPVPARRGWLTLAALVFMLGGCDDEGEPSVDDEPDPMMARDRGAAEDTHADADPPSGLTEAVSRFGAAEMTGQSLVGLGLAVASPGRPMVATGFGLADREARIPVSAEQTLFRWASLSKTVTGVLATQLATEGSLAWDEPVDRYVPEYRVPATYLEACTGGTRTVDGETYTCKTGFFDLPLAADLRVVTPRRLAGHLGGIMHYTNGRGAPVPPSQQTANPVVNTGMAWALANFQTLPLVAVPGTRYAYSTFGHNLLGVVLERASGRSFAALTDERIARKLGLTTLQPDYEWKVLAGRAAGYARNTMGAIVRQRSTDVSWKLAGGGFISSVSDLVRYCVGLAGDDLLTTEQKQLTWAPMPTTAGTNTSYGVGFVLGRRNGRPYVEHAGSQEKTQSRLRLYPDEDLCLVAVTNSVYGDTARLIQGLEDAVRASPSGP